MKLLPALVLGLATADRLKRQSEAYQPYYDDEVIPLLVVFTEMNRFWIVWRSICLSSSKLALELLATACWWSSSGMIWVWGWD